MSYHHITSCCLMSNDIISCQNISHHEFISTRILRFISNNFVSYQSSSYQTKSNQITQNHLQLMIHYGAASPKLPRIKTSIVLLSPDRMSLRQHAWYRVASMWLPGLLDSGHFRPRTVIPLTISHKYFWSNQMLPLQPLILTICFGFWGIKSTLGPHIWENPLIHWLSEK